MGTAIVGRLYLSPNHLRNPNSGMELSHVSATSTKFGVLPSTMLNSCLNGNASYSKEQYIFSSSRIKILRKNNSSSISCMCRSVFPTFLKTTENKMRYEPSGRASNATFQSCKATRDDSARAVSGESVLLNEQTLERELQIAIEQENYTEAAKIRDRIRLLHEDSKSSVLAVNAKFYNAFRTGDLASMQTLWAQEDNVCCVHPGASGISGYELVMRSWEYVWIDYEFPLEIELRDVQVHVRGDVGYVNCVELVKTKGSSWGRQFATNVFERINGQWFICIHHASPVDL